MSSQATAVPVTPAAADARALRRVLLNGAALLGAYVVPRTLTFMAALVAARVLQPGAFGAYGGASALAMILSVLCTLGMLQLLVREIARAPAAAGLLVAAAHRLKLATGCVMLGALLVGARAVGMRGELLVAVLALGVGHVCWGFAENYGARLQAEERMHVWLRANIVFGVGSALLGGAAVLATASVAWFCIGFAAGQALALAYLWLRAAPSDAAPAATGAEARRLALAAAPFAAGILVLTAFYKFDVLLLARLAGLHEAGVYAAGYKLVDVVHALGVVGAAAAYPRLARAGAGEECNGARRMIELFLLAAVPVAAMLWLSRASLVALLFGNGYEATAAVLALLAPATALLAVNIAVGCLLALAHRMHRLAVAYGAALTCKLALGMLWMPQHGAYGAAAAMFAGEVVAICLLAGAVVRTRAVLPRSRPLLLAGLGAAWALVVGAIAAGAVGAALFGITTIVLYAVGGAFTAAERASFGALLSGRAHAGALP